MYITKEKYFNYVSTLMSMELDEELFQELLEAFQENFDYSPERSTYSSENYHKSRENNLEKSGGQSARSPSQKKANDKYNESKREERNKKARERYHRLKLERESPATP